MSSPGHSANALTKTGRQVATTSYSTQHKQEKEPLTSPAAKALQSTLLYTADGPERTGALTCMMKTPNPLKKPAHDINKLPFAGQRFLQPSYVEVGVVKNENAPSPVVLKHRVRNWPEN